ncbi:MAG: GNAT family N-acetyltransferase [Geminicoccaceae bacterium]
MLVVRDNPAMSRFEMPSGDAIAFIEYRRAGDRIVLIHTEVPEALSGQGVGSKLVGSVLDQIRSQGSMVVARCEFVSAFIRRHPGYQSLEIQE